MMEPIIVSVSNVNKFGFVIHGENLAEQFGFDFTEWVEAYGAGTISMRLRRNGDANPYPVILTTEGNIAIWSPTETDTAKSGVAKAQLIYSAGETIAKTLVFNVRVAPSLGPTTDPPEPFEDWLDQLTDLADETQQNAEDAAQSAADAEDAKGEAIRAKDDAVIAKGDAEEAKRKAEEAQGLAETAQGKAEEAVTHYPKIDGGYWYVWSDGWVNTGVKAEGVDGKGITNIATVKSSTSGLTDTYTMTVTYTDNTTATFTFTVTNGEDGITPTVSVTSITGGHNVAFDYGTGDPRNTDFDVLDGEVSEADLTAVANAKAPVIVDTASGSIASFPDGSDGMPIKEMTVQIEPVQDLSNGDPSPQNICPIYGWTGCGITRTGENLFDISVLTQASSWSYTDGAYTGTSSNLYSRFGQDTKYLINFPKGYEGQLCVRVNYSQDTSGNGLGIKFVYTDGTNSGTYVAHDAEYAWKVWKSTSGKTVSKIRVNYGASKTLHIKQLGVFAYKSDDNDDYDFTYKESFAPVFFSSKNLFNGSFKQGYWAFANGTWSDSNVWIATGLIPCKPNTDYVTSWSNGYTTRYQGFVWYGASGRYLGANNSQASATNGKTFKSPANAAYMVYNIAGTTSSTNISPSDIQNFQIEEGTTASAYEAPTIVYGGTLTISEDGSVKLTANLKYTTVADHTWTYFNGTTPFFYYTVTDGKDQGKFISSAYSRGSGNGKGIVTSNTLRIYDSAYTDPSAFKTARGDVQICYELATPVEYDLADVTILSTLKGDNNVWTDTGDISVDYRADTKLFIEKLTMPTEDDMVANSAITSGSYFMIGNSLYLALANIANGAQITIGTNAQRVSLAEALNAINS